MAALDGVLRDPEQQRERRSVERTAKTLAGEKAELQGTLKRVPFALLLRRLYAQKATGSLLLLHDAAKKDATKKIVAFVDGYPVSVKSNVLAECLGQILVSRKLITDKALAESVARMKTEKRQQGQILVEMGALSPYNLQRALVEQVEAKLFEVFSWPDGKFMFKESELSLEDTSPGQALRLERPPAALILEGIRRHYDDARQRAVLDAYVRQAVDLNPDPVLRLQDVTTDPTALGYINSIDGTESIAEILARAPIAQDEARLLLVALSEAGMITNAEGPSARRRRAAAVPAAIAPAPSGFVAAVAPAQASGALSGGQLSMVAETVRTQDYFWTLGVERDATPTDIDRAYDAHARSFHPDRYRYSSDEDRRLAQEIFERLGEAHRTLSDPARRRAYVAKIEKSEKSEKPDKTDRPAGATPTTARPADTPHELAPERPRTRRPAPSTRRASSTCAPAATTRPSRPSARPRASSPTRPSTAPPSGGRSSARRPPTRAPGAPPRRAAARRPARRPQPPRRRVPRADLRPDRPTGARHRGARTPAGARPQRRGGRRGAAPPSRDALNAPLRPPRRAARVARHVRLEQRLPAAHGRPRDEHERQLVTLGGRRRPGTFGLVGADVEDLIGEATTAQQILYGTQASGDPSVQ